MSSQTRPAPIEGVFLAAADRADAAPIESAQDALARVIGLPFLQNWVDHALAASELGAARVAVRPARSRTAIVAVAGQSELIEGHENSSRWSWGRAPEPMQRMARTASTESPLWSGSVTVEFARRRSADNEALLNLLVAALGASVDAAIAMDTSSRLRGAVLTGRDLANEHRRAFELAFAESIVGMAVVALRGEAAGRFARVNDKLRHITGRAEAELLETNFVELLDPEDRRPQESAYRRVLAGRRAPFSSEGRLLRPDNSFTWVTVKASPLLDDRGDPSWLIVQVEELKQRGSHESELAGRLDHLTGLLNPSGFETAITAVCDRARRTEDPAAICLVQVADWPQILGQYGASVADELQRQVAQRLRAALRVDDAVGRLGENEFAFLAEEIDPEGAMSLANRVVAAMSGVHAVGDQQISVRLQLGAVMIGAHNDSPGELAVEARSAAHAAGRRDESVKIELDTSRLDGAGGHDRMADGGDAARVYRHRRR